MESGRTDGETFCALQVEVGSGWITEGSLPAKFCSLSSESSFFSPF